MTANLPHLDTAALDTAALGTDRLQLEPLTVEHSAEMAVLLNDPALHTYTGGEPLSASDLRAQYVRQAVGRSGDGSERWLNWIIRLGSGGDVVGYVQATVTVVDGRLTADVAWVIGSGYQGRGYASEAARLMVDWLRLQGVPAVTAHIHPDHEASKAVATHLGLHPTKNLVDGEIRWQD